ncbi:MAG: hypothetical protein PHX61_01535 [Alphaproteobacteria bacterium]|nr:hypothetical protein [Alphaproteobacteria bacterium]
MWSYVTAHFGNFQRNIALRSEEHDDALAKAERVARCLHNVYYNEEFTLDKLLVIGSYVKETAIRPSFDVDLMYFLPEWVFRKYESYESGGQSALLQNVRENLLQTFPTTTIKADGQAVIVDYQSRRFEVVPAFIFQGQIYIADTSNGGRWKPTNPIKEARLLHQADVDSNGHARHLIKYLKVWKRAQDVPFKSIILEHAAINFVRQWYCLESSLSVPVYWHDWIVRDFFGFLLQYDHLTLPHNEVIYFGDGWKRKAEAAYKGAVQACIYEQSDLPLMAEKHWKNIFGSQFLSLQPPPSQQIVSRGLLTGV